MTPTATGHRYLLPLDAVTAQHTELVGGKAAALARLAAADFEVPEAVVLTTRAFDDTFGSEPDSAPPGDRPLPSSVEEALLKLMRRFGDAALAVRSSSVSENLAAASFAGQYETILGVRGVEPLVDAVRQCWASAFSARVGGYRHERSIAGRSMAVLIQRQVDPIAAGVAFTADPITGARGVTIINAVSGLADEFSAGKVTPEEWRVSDTVERTSGPDHVLTGDQAHAVADLANRVASYLGTPQDVEWALDGTRLWLLQARPITALPEGPIAPVPIRVDVPDGYWERLATHFPDPSSPLARSIVHPIINEATATLGPEFGILLDRVAHAEIGGWTYIRTVPFGGKDRRPPPPWLGRIMVRLHPDIRGRVRAAAEAVATDKAGRYIRRWYEEWMPGLARREAELRDVDLPTLTDPELGSHFETCVGLLDDGLRTHFGKVFPAQMLGVYALIAAAEELFGWKPAQAFELLVGLSQRSSEPGRRLSELARIAAERPQMRAMLDAIDEETASRLGEIAPEFASRFEAYRREYGLVSLSRDVKDPSMGERPELLLHLVANQLAAGFDPSHTDHDNAHQRERAVAEARRALAARPARDRERFEEALRRAERAYPIREDNLFYTLFTPLGLLRRAALELGRRLAEHGQIDGASDVFFLEREELVAAFTSGEGQRELVARRKGELASALDHPGPASYGQPPGQPLALDFLPREARHTMKALLTMIGLTAGSPHRGRSLSAVLEGIPASAGTYTGTVRVIHNEGEFDKLRAGDVLVCPMTSPTWSLLFPSVGALVTDSGGILNHPAIIAREYRIPAVVATVNATTLLTDGHIVTVDGSAGTVTIAPADGSGSIGIGVSAVPQDGL